MDAQMRPDYVSSIPTKREHRQLRRAGLVPPQRSEKKAELNCSFCDKPKKDVRKLIRGPGVSICDRCVALCVEILAEPAEPTHQ
jgi:hypothetical protein